MRKIMLILAVSAAAAFAAPHSAWAYDCDTKVVDDVGRLTADDGPKLNAAIQDLENLGAEVRIRIVKDLGGSGLPTIDAYETSLLRSCPSWQSANGFRKSNLVVLAISYNTGGKNNAGLYYGETWTSQLRGQWPSMLKQSIGPLMKAGRDGDALAMALGNVTNLIKPTGAAAAPVSTVTIDNRKPTNLAGLWYVLGGLLLLGIGIAVFFLLRSRRRDQEARKAAQQKAQATKASCSAKIVDYDDAKMAVLEVTVDNALAMASEEDAAPLRARFARLKEVLGTATVQFGELQQSKSDPSFNDYAPATYVNIERAYQEVLDRLHDVEADKLAIEEGAARLQKLAAAGPTKVAEAKKAVSDAKSARKTVSDKGFKTPASDAQMTQAEAQLAAAEKAITDKRFAAAGTIAAEVQRLAALAAATAEDAPIQFAAAGQTVADLKHRLETSIGAIASARPILVELASAYAASCSTKLKGNCELADGEVFKARRDVDQAEAGAKMDTQDLEGVRTHAASASGALDRAEAYVEAIHALKDRLETAHRDAPAGIASARTRIGVVRTYIANNADGIQPGHATALDAEEAKLKALEAKLKENKPDYLEVIASAQASQAAAGTILKTAQDEHELMVRKRQQAANALRDAKLAVKETKAYLTANDGDLSDGPTRTLAMAEKHLLTAGAVTALDAIMASAEDAQTAAGNALKTAKAEVAAAERVREAERQRLALIAAQEAAAAAAAQAEADRQAALIAMAAQAAIDAEYRQRTSYVPTYAPTPTYEADDSNRGGGYAGGSNSDGGGGSVTVDTSDSNNDGGGGSVDFSQSDTPSSDGGGDSGSF